MPDKNGTSDHHQFQTRFFNQLDHTRGIAHLINYMPDVYFFVKNRDSQFTKMNKTMLELLGREHEHEVLGKTDRDFFATALADKYIEEDQKVMEGRKPFVNQVWLVPDSRGLLVWFLCTKIPLFDKRDRVVGIAGMLVDYKAAGAVLDPYAEMAEVVQYINNDYPKDIRVETLAQMVHLSISQFERKFKRLVHMSPIKYITQIRLNAACKLLSHTSRPITQVAIQTGFYDHSHFSTKFKQQLGISPTEYRKQYFQSN
ncbi:MAG: AraC family transcriptional regulator [Phycisphaeraceae bacterium]|nr:AraC family transcriptional regulator [Phycisphaeraceae bacterium]